MIAIENIAININRKPVLEQIHFRMLSGQITALLGGNGAGKSTLLKTIAGSMPYYRGNISIMNIPLSEWTDRALSKLRGVLSQNISLTFPMKVIDLVLLGRYPYFQNQKATTRDVAIAYETLDLMGLAQKAEQNVLELSGGEQQRVQIARVLSQVWDSSAKHPKVLLLDEPTSNLDIAYQHSLLQLLREKAKKQGLSILIILHDMNLAARYVDQIILLKNGQQRIVGPPEETLTEYWIKDAFGVSSVIQNHPVFNCIQVSTY